MNYFIDERRHYGPAAAKLRSGKYLTPNPMLIAHLQGRDGRDWIRENAGHSPVDTIGGVDIKSGDRLGAHEADASSNRSG
eukprot:5115588-Pyramimonas_sp.AAC.1